MLSFAWKVRDHSTARLLGAFVLMVVLMAGFFLIFRITYPTMQRASATPQRVLVLDPSDPRSQAIIHRAEDKSFALFPSETRGKDTLRYLPPFQPSFHESKLTLLPPSHAPETIRPPRLFTPDTSVMARVPPRATAPPDAPPASVLRAVPGAELARRAPASLTLENVPLADPQSILFRVAIGSAGQVLLALPLTSSEDADVMRRLQSAISALRFTPDPKTPRLWGTISLRWEPASPN